MDYDKIRKEIIKIVGQSEYNLRLVEIAEMLDRLKTDDFPEGDGAEELAAKVVAETVIGKRQAKFGNRWTCTTQLTSLEAITEKHDDEDSNDAVRRIATGNVNKFVKIQTAPKKAQRFSLKDRMDRVQAVRDALLKDSKLLLSKMPSGEVGHQTMNDWLSDLKGKTLDRESKYLNEMIDECFKISKQNYKRHTATDLIRRTVTKEELLGLSCREICDKYDFDYSSGSIRKFISRLKRKELGVA